MIGPHTSPLHSRLFCQHTSLLFRALHLEAGQKGEAEDSLASSIFWEHPSSDQCLCGVKADLFLPWEENPATLPNAQSSPLKHSTASEARREFSCLGREEVMAVNPEPQPGHQAVPPWQCQPSSAVPSMVPVPTHPVFIARCSHVWNELLQNVGCATKSQRTVYFHCTECGLKEVQM